MPDTGSQDANPMATSDHRMTCYVKAITSGCAALPSAHPALTPAHSTGMKGNGW
ncbi:hypothetical protein NORO109296_15590 [Nocardiopsis rhodophaea]